MCYHKNIELWRTICLNNMFLQTCLGFFLSRLNHQQQDSVCSVLNFRESFCCLLIFLINFVFVLKLTTRSKRSSIWCWNFSYHTRKCLNLPTRWSQSTIVGVIERLEKLGFATVLFLRVPPCCELFDVCTPRIGDSCAWSALQELLRLDGYELNIWSKKDLVRIITVAQCYYSKCSDVM